jgi:caffeoyl-CoA O-methyltransferase
MPAAAVLALQEGNKGKFDFAFVDADKVNFLNYHERLLQLLRVGGLIAYDNTLWGGSVAAPHDEPLSERDRALAAATREFNAAVAADPRVHVCQVAIADGLTLCRRVA